MSDSKNHSSTKNALASFISIKMLCTLLLNCALLFHNSKTLRMTPSQRKFISIGFIFISVALGVLSVIEGTKKYMKGEFSGNDDGSRYLFSIYVIGLMFTGIQVYIGYLMSKHNNNPQPPM